MWKFWENKSTYLKKCKTKAKIINLFKDIKPPYCTSYHRNLFLSKGIFCTFQCSWFICSNCSLLWLSGCLWIVRHKQVTGEGLDCIRASHLLLKKGKLNNMKVFIEISNLIQVFRLNPTSGDAHGARFLAGFFGRGAGLQLYCACLFHTWSGPEPNAQSRTKRETRRCIHRQR